MAALELGQLGVDVLAFDALVANPRLHGLPFVRSGELKDEQAARRG
jgi:hypothetical protein